MQHTFAISEFESNHYGEDGKKQGSRGSHEVGGEQEVVELSIGPIPVTNPNGTESTRHLTRHEIVFGLKGWGGLVIWRASEANGGNGEIIVDTARARYAEKDGPWVVDFVRQIILAEATRFRNGKTIILKHPWKIEKEQAPEDLVRRYKTLFS